MKWIKKKKNSYIVNLEEGQKEISLETRKFQKEMN